MGVTLDNEISCASAAREIWDAIIIGTGMGGATLGYELVKQGHRVLFVEKGKAAVTSLVPEDGLSEDSQKRLAAAYWPDRITVEVDGKRSHIFAPLGCGVGGTSILYAATLERFERCDVEQVEGKPPPTSPWPIAWDALVPYYESAERLYRVVGTPDPLTDEPQGHLLPPPRASPIDEQFMRTFAAAGLHPHRLHIGIGYQAGCTECGGRPCPRQCKSDARTICLAPALGTGRAALVTECEAVRLEANWREVQAVVCYCQGRLYQLRGRSIVLAAGAYHSPAILLRSKCTDWPNGVANGSDQVGRNLMFHADAWTAVWPHRRASADGPRKAISLRDFYTQDGVRFGVLQSTGLTADYGNIYYYLLNWFDQSSARRLKALRPLLRIPAKIAALLLGQATIFTLLIQDFPHSNNRVVLDEDHPERIRAIYSIPDELRERANLARNLLSDTLGGLWTMPLQLGVQLNFGHPCGTCRFGHDPATSVLDENCRAHELNNLYIVDSSFMPSSGGANPSLTIAANALRVADALNNRLKAPRIEIASRKV